ncbi:hypothetical protein AZI98_17260 [Aeribacillus pallidus]|jgi:hypothetical protein|uniref:Uncharacterized protein n=1 Tax=Aeribacillus pallidus TaxID=33936 RepID=A0A167YZS3_9BACI|nr:hypothetical protein AZI98_17260 [Aeribacillus pallidus]
MKELIKGNKVSLIIVLLFSIIFNFLGLFFHHINTTNDLISFTYGYVDLWHVNNVFSIIRWLLPQLILLVYLGNYIEVRLLKNATLIFTRTNKKMKILLQFILQLLFIICCFYLLQFMIVIIIGAILGLELVLNIETMFIIMRLILYSFLIILTVNSSSILFKSIYGVYLVLIIQLAMLYISNLILNWNSYFLVYIPTTNALVSLNDNGLGINNDSSIVYLLILIFIVIIISINIFNKKEVLY